MDRTINIGLLLLSLVMAALFYNIGFIINPEVGVFNNSILPENGLATTFRIFMIAAAFSVVSTLVALIGSVWQTRAKIASVISISILIVIGAITWWEFSTLFYRPI